MVLPKTLPIFTPRSIERNVKVDVDFIEYSSSFTRDHCFVCLWNGVSWLIPGPLGTNRVSSGHYLEDEVKNGRFNQDLDFRTNRY